MFLQQRTEYLSNMRLIRAALGIASVGFLVLGLLSLGILFRGRQHRSDPNGSDERLPIVVLTKELTVKSSEAWQSSGVRVTPDETVRVQASGKVCWSFNNPDGSGCVGPEGAWYAANQLVDKSGFPTADAKCGSLIARVGGAVYAVGNAASFSPQQEGVLEFMVNDRLQWLWDNKGTFNVILSVTK
jgi:hypothetical protein